ncbi:hypothetical protein GCM10010191_24640 [Actinomadura vinacea]|uniref:LPXTG cell wall anchor domain-containing protein n=1 Tax=Actinomadura vinacea TaxID=115336 RepID=A0ABP5W0I0_9ACTN
MVVTLQRARRARPQRLARPGPRRARWTGRGLIAGGAAMVPWTVAVASRLPSAKQVSNWSLAWTGLDAAIAAGLLGTGALLAQGDVRHRPAAAATAALLVMDAWFDMTTAAAGPERARALALAIGAELPMAALCGYLALRAGDQSTPEPGADGGTEPDG